MKAADSVDSSADVPPVWGLSQSAFSDAAELLDRHRDTLRPDSAPDAGTSGFLAVPARSACLANTRLGPSRDFGIVGTLLRRCAGVVEA